MLPTNARLIYENPLQSETDVAGFKMEGEAQVTFPEGKMRMENLLDPSLGQESNFVYWCPESFPENIAISWEFKPLREPGLAILFFGAAGMNGEDLFDSKLKVRKGMYRQYHHGDIHAYHVSYFRRRYKDVDRKFHTCNLRKSYGFHLVCQGADPIPSCEDVQEPYQLLLLKRNGNIKFYINELLIFDWQDDGETWGPLIKGGRIGFRQMAPLIAEYADFKVYEIEG
ncbi:DUF1961 family protein [Chengkuizengella axinellae]|uniref:DUF1961 family protein n=1 Tax=Chengkuizengella axinellae TaxID=3064388 RepID=A0ABT9IZY7_9BACL|nr:DUF1961 family protein [Chengkuizengella sp. 2205SS18-9]MDP5274783.1 DUF1961 family protein [Chengkuizengella sp. 2205SS18-9]